MRSFQAAIRRAPTRWSADCLRDSDTSCSHSHIVIAVSYVGDDGERSSTLLDKRSADSPSAYDFVSDGSLSLRNFFPSPKGSS